MPEQVGDSADVIDNADASRFELRADGWLIEEWAADDATAILYQAGAYTPPWLAASGPTDAEGAG
jgi:hypothetical protein